MLQNTGLTGLDMLDKFLTELDEMTMNLRDCEVWLLEPDMVPGGPILDDIFDEFWNNAFVKTCMSDARESMDNCKQADLAQHHDAYSVALHDLEDICGVQTGGDHWYQGSMVAIHIRCVLS